MSTTAASAPSLRYAGWLFIALAVLTVFAFWPSYTTEPPPLVFTPYHHFHAVVSTLWLLLLIVQPFLINRGKIRLHRQLGRSTYVLMPLMLLGFLLLTHHAIQGKTDGAFRVEAYLSYLRIALGLACGGFWALAIYHRKQRGLHGRLMICAGLTVVDPTLSRVVFEITGTRELNYQAITFGTVALLLLAFAALERRDPQARRVYLGATAAYLLLGLPPMLEFWRWEGPFRAWGDVVRWFGTLPLT